MGFVKPILDLLSLEKLSSLVVTKMCSSRKYLYPPPWKVLGLTPTPPPPLKTPLEIAAFSPLSLKKFDFRLPPTPPLPPAPPLEFPITFHGEYGYFPEPHINVIIFQESRHLGILWLFTENFTSQSVLFKTLNGYSWTIVKTFICLQSIFSLQICPRKH